MKKSRRDFIKHGGMAAAAIAATKTFSPTKSFGGILRTPEVELPQDDVVRGLMMTAINTAKSAGASYSDVRIGRYHNSVVFTREQQIVNTADVDNKGAGVRALVDGTWGFGATKTLTTDGVAAARERPSRSQRRIESPATNLSSSRRSRRIRMRRGRARSRSIPSPFQSRQRADLLLKANAERSRSKAWRFVNSGLLFVKEDRNFASTEGTVISQTIVRVAVPFQITAVAPDNSDFQTRANVVAPAGRGWEYVLEQDLVGNAASGPSRRFRNSTASQSRSDATISFSTRRTSGSRSTNQSRIRLSSIARSGTRRTTPAPVSSRPPTKSLANSATARSS